MASTLLSPTTDITTSAALLISLGQGSTDDDVDVATTPPWVIILHATTLAFIAIASGFLNVVVIYTIHKKTYLQNASNRFVFSMTIANAVTTFTVLPFNLAVCVMREWIFGVVWCNLMGFITLCTLTGTFFNIALITLDRYYAIVQPMLYPLKVTSNYTTHMIVCMWLLALVCTLPPSFGWSRYSFHPAKSACMVDWHHHKSFSGFYAIMTTIFPFSLIAYCYGKILKVARQSSRRVSHGNVVVEEAIRNMTRRRSRRTSLLVNIRMNSPTKALRTVLITVSAILITWVPFIVELVYETIIGVELIADWLEAGAMWLVYCSLFINPCIYALWNKTVRNEILGMFCARSVSLQWAWRDDDKIAARRRESRRISISGSITDLSYTSALKGKLMANSTQVTTTGNQTSTCSNDSVVSGVPLASILEMPPSTPSSSSSARHKKRVRLSGGPKKDVSHSQLTRKVKATADIHVPNGRVSSSSMVTRSQAKREQDLGGAQEDNTRKLSIVSIEENSIGSS